VASSQGEPILYRAFSLFRWHKLKVIVITELAHNSAFIVEETNLVSPQQNGRPQHKEAAQNADCESV
jgi:hypothetical protein